jgi:hypothetical protein
MIMVCPECNGRGKAIYYYVETDRDENTVTAKKREDICRTCNGSGEKPQTNADRIRAMSDEELAETLVQYDDFCGVYMADDGMKYYDFEAAKEAELEWLKQPAETHTENANRCVCCGEIIPEGRQVCPNCLATVKKGKDYGRENIE